MTVVGKILVFLNLVFSLVVGAFAVLSYTAGSNHAAGFKELKDRYTVLSATSDAYKAENDKLRDQARTFRAEVTKRGVKESDDVGEMAKRMGAVIVARDQRIEALEKALKDAKDDAGAKGALLADAGITADNAKSAVARRNKEAKDMRDAMASLSTKNSELGKKLSTEMDLRVKAELDSATLKDQNKQLAAAQTDLLRELQKVRSSLARGPSAPGARPGGMDRVGSRENPPPENVEGRITKVDKDLVTVSVGKDSGLVVGNTLQVFRLGPTPKYIGTIRLVEVLNKQAVGRIQGRPSVGPRVNDMVASNILGGS